MTPEKNNRALELLKELEALGYEVKPGSFDNGQASDKSPLEDRIKTFSMSSTVNDWWVRGGWNMSF